MVVTNYTILDLWYLGGGLTMKGDLKAAAFDVPMKTDKVKHLLFKGSYDMHISFNSSDKSRINNNKNLYAYYMLLKK